ncbi:isocitrate and isopropylmalate dehydrogenases family [Artemisia annua]|uniref:Isocitrate and isopropylmalate dehydrogenases family n=1 Tax=Artemisia annua TaxID=35608 RepID=A0A2U1ND99_ARTAN|nr:isocitrate and isopropylmalate dehydrogenases family [Artemisia annua]
MVEKKIGNPVALLLSSTMMLRYLQLPDYPDRLETAVRRVIYEGKYYRTKDLGGSRTTQEVADTVISALK